MAPFPLGHQIGNSWNQQPLNRKNVGLQVMTVEWTTTIIDWKSMLYYLLAMNYNIFRDALGSPRESKQKQPREWTSGFLSKDQCNARFSGFHKNRRIPSINCDLYWCCGHRDKLDGSAAKSNMPEVGPQIFETKHLETRSKMAPV